ncbi:MAG: gamma-glutamyltransferase, partial [Anaerolineae bacterium]
MFPSRRSVVMARRGMVATSQPLAAQAGLRILQWGGSAADAAVAAAAVLNVVEPMSTGVGGDMFALVHNPATGQTRALNGSGGAGAAATVAKINQLGFDAIPETHHGLAVTVPGAVDGWLTLLEAYGRLSLADVLSPAIYYAEKGFPVSPLIAAAWQRTEEKLQANQAAAQAFLIHGKAPRVGQIFRQPQLAETLRLIARGGREAFYQGFLAEQIAAAVQKNGGLLTTDDLAAHQSVWDEPVSMAYRGHRLVECPPNGQGIVALQTLGILS